MKEIYQYNHYRRFLGDYFAESKRTTPAFSHQFFARKAGISSTGFMLHVIKGERNLTVPVMHKVARAVGLDRDETEFFELLVLFDQAKDQKSKDYYFRKIMSCRREKSTLQLQDMQYEFYNQWYHSVVRELLAMVDQPLDFARLGKMVLPRLSASQARSSVKLMEKLGIVGKRDDGAYALNHAYIEGSGSVNQMAIVNFQRKMLELAQQSWENSPPGEANIHTLTLSMSEELADEIKHDIESFRKRMVEKVLNEKKAAEKVYQLNITIHPVSKRIEGGTK